MNFTHYLIRLFTYKEKSKSSNGYDDDDIDEFLYDESFSFNLNVESTYVNTMAIKSVEVVSTRFRVLKYCNFALLIIC